MSYSKQNLFKIAILGEDGVGKTEFTESFISNMSNQHFQVVVIPSENLEVLDTACDSNSRFNHLGANYRGCRAFLIALDSTDDESLNKINTYWLKSLKNHAGSQIPIIIIGTKSDLTPQISDKRAKQFAIEMAHQHRLNVTYFGNTSAKENHNIENLFETIASKIIAYLGPQVAKENKTQISSLDATTELSCKNIFLNKHRELFNSDKEGFFSCWRNSNMKPEDSLSELIKYAQDNNNRSRTAFVELGWMDADGFLTKSAPDPVKDAISNENATLLNEFTLI